MNIVASDLATLLMFLPVPLAIAAVAIVLERHGRYAPSRLFTRPEWVLLGKLAAIPLLAAILLLAKIAMDFPAEIFLYGRF